MKTIEFTKEELAILQYGFDSPGTVLNLIGNMKATFPEEEWSEEMMRRLELFRSICDKLKE